MTSQGRLRNNSKCGDGRIEVMSVVFVVGIIPTLGAAFPSFHLFCLPFNYKPDGEKSSFLM